MVGEHKTAQFADDVLVYLTHPAHSNPALLQILSEFQSLHRYKLNSRKSELLIFNYTTSQKFKNRYDIKKVDSMKYLGVPIPKDLTGQVSRNHDPLLSSIRKDMAKWSLFPFPSLIQRVEIVKMNVISVSMNIRRHSRKDIC